MASLRASNFAGVAVGQRVFSRAPEFLMLQEDPIHLSSLWPLTVGNTEPFGASLLSMGCFERVSHSHLSGGPILTTMCHSLATLFSNT